jgi:hypothetical protein
MPTNHEPASVVFAVAIGASLAAPAAAQNLAKSGTFTGKAGLQASGQINELEKGHLFFLGKIEGVIVNDVAGGFLGETQWACS